MSGKGKQQVQQTPQAQAQKSEDNVDCVCYGAARKKENCPLFRNVSHPLRYYEFTQEELKALEECDQESFYRRCVPFSALFATITYAAIKCGHISKHPHFGVFPKVLLAMAFGHVYGRFAYIGHCEEKLRKLPGNSYLGNTMRKYHDERITPPKK